MKALYIITLFGLTACAKKVPMANDFLSGKTAIEIVETEVEPFTDTIQTHFYKNGIFLRTGEVYMQNEGNYKVENDTLIIFYDAIEFGNLEGAGEQRYVLKDDGKLHLIYMVDKFAKVTDLDHTSVDTELELRDK